jgi:ATP-binding cassette, subfamily B, bacterial
VIPALVVQEKLAPEDRAKIFRRLARLLRPHRWKVVLAATLVIGQAASTLAGPTLIRRGIDQGVAQGDLRALDQTVLLFGLSALATYLCGRAAILTLARVGETVLRELRERVFTHVTRLSLDFYERNRTGVIVSRVTADIDAMQELVGQGLASFIVSGLLFVGAVGVMISMSWQLALGTLILVPIVVRASIWFRRESNIAYLAVRDRIGGTLTSLQEGIVGVRVIQAFSQAPHRTRRFQEVNEAQYKAHMTTERIAAIYFPVIDLCQGAALATILVLGGWLTTRDAVTVGVVAAFVLYMQNLFEPIQQLSQLFQQLQAAGAALKKLFGLLDEEPSVPERSGAVDLPATGGIEVDEVSFRYASDGPEVLSDVSISVAPGERLALVGPTGAGKSTLAKLMARFYDPTSGSVSFGGIDLRDGTLASLRRRMVVVPQEGFLFSGTIRDNLRIGRPSASDEEIFAALDRYGLREQVAGLGDGLDTEVAERGANFSAGERQLVSIARCALADPAVIVLDEATSSLDLGTELLIEQALDRLMAGRTVIVIAHRLTTAERADRVAVVDGGRLTELGTHAELLALDGHYARLYEAWAGSTSPTPDSTVL